MNNLGCGRPTQAPSIFTHEMGGRANAHDGEERIMLQLSGLGLGEEKDGILMILIGGKTVEN